jgi:subtilisin family serine protease
MDFHPFHCTPVGAFLEFILDKSDAKYIMELGKNPGLGIRTLHQMGITGKGVYIGLIDQGLLTQHVEYKDRLRFYEEIHCLDDEATMHGPATASILAGKTAGVAPEATLY